MSSERLAFDAVDLPPSAQGLRAEVRGFLAAEWPQGCWPNSDFGAGHDPAFSRQLGKRGWIGMTWPKEYGGGERTFFERYMVTEELLAAGAPVSAHWIADRQSGPLLLRFGSEAQRRRYLPGYGIHPMHFGIIFLANLEIGYFTPPVGINLFISSYRFDRPMIDVYAACLPFMAVMLMALLLITYVPWFSLWHL